MHILSPEVLTIILYFRKNFFFCLQLWNGQNKNETKKKRKSKDEVKAELLRSIVGGQEYKNADLKNRAEKEKRYHDAIPKMQEYEIFIQGQKETY